MVWLRVLVRGVVALLRGRARPVGQLELVVLASQRLCCGARCVPVVLRGDGWAMRLERHAEPECIVAVAFGGCRRPTSTASLMPALAWSRSTPFAVVGGRQNGTVLATVVTTLNDLGVPGLVGVALGSLLSYLFGKRLLDDQATRTREMLAVQTERDAADQVEVALNGLHIAARDVPVGESPKWGLLHNRWQDEVLMPAARIHDRDLQVRITAVGQAIFYASMWPEEQLVFGVLHAIENATNGLRAFLANKPQPPSFFPDSKELFRIIWGVGGGRPNLDAYREWLADHPRVD